MTARTTITCDGCGTDVTGDEHTVVQRTAPLIPAIDRIPKHYCRNCLGRNTLPSKRKTG